MSEGMEQVQLKIGWGLLLVWLISMWGLTTNYRSIATTMEHVEELGNTIEELKSTLYLDPLYRMQSTELQSLDLQLIDSMRAQIASENDSNWLAPDIQQLLWTIERFSEQMQGLLNNDLELLALAKQIQVGRSVHQQDTDIAQYYYRLGANVFAAIFSSDEMSPATFRDLDSLYLSSVTLPSEQRQNFQRLLAQTSQVLGGYAQGSYLTEKLLSHSVHDQIAAVEDQYHSLIRSHLVLGMIFSGVVMLAQLVLWQGSLGRRGWATAEPMQPVEVNENHVTPGVGQREVMDQSQAVTPSSVTTQSANTQSTNIQSGNTQSTDNQYNGTQSAPSITSSLHSHSSINFNEMLNSLSGDKESMCLLLELFIQDHKHDVAKITTLVTDAPEEAMRKAHSLKGVGGNLGAQELKQAAGNLEIAIRDDVSAIPELLDMLDKHLNQAIHEAERELAKAK